MAQETKTILSIQYARWSDPSQAKGNSKARQFSKMREEAARHGYKCQLEVFDDGRSAFHGHHIDKGELGRLLERIDEGEFIGWVLQIENVDRISRQGHDAVRELCNRITRAGVSIRTCDGEFLEAYKPVKLAQAITLAVKAETAREEGIKRQSRAQSSWAIRLDEAKKGKALPGVAPPWCRRVGDEYVINEEYAKQAAYVWVLCDRTGNGGHKLCRLLNEAGVPMFGSGKPWYSSRVDLILSGMEVIGYHQPMKRNAKGKRVPHGEPIKIFPPIIPHDLFERVRAGAVVRLETHGGGRSERIANLLSGRCRCASCGRSMRLAGSSSGGGYLMCTGRDRGLCANRVTYRYRPFETTVLDEFLHLALDDNAFANKSEVSRVNALIAEREIEHRVKIEEATHHLTLGAKSPISMKLGLDAEASAQEIEQNLASLRAQRESAKGRADAAEHIARVKDMRDRLGSDIDLRRKVLQAFNTVIEDVAFGANGIATLRLVGGIMELKIDCHGNPLEGEANLTTNEEALAKHDDPKVISIARAVAQRFAKVAEKGQTNWELNDGAVITQ